MPLGNLVLTLDILVHFRPGSTIYERERERFWQGGNLRGGQDSEQRGSDCSWCRFGCSRRHRSYHVFNRKTEASKRISNRLTNIENVYKDSLY